MISEEDEGTWASFIRRELTSRKYIFSEPHERVIVLPFKGDEITYDLNVLVGAEEVNEDGFVVFVIVFPFIFSQEKHARVLSAMNEWNIALPQGAYELKLPQNVARFKYGRRLKPGLHFDEVMEDLTSIVDLSQHHVSDLIALL
jgi:hypothetical protein